MAKSRDNLIMEGTSGRVGRSLIFRLRGDQTIIAKRPRHKVIKTYSADQVTVMNKFTRAALYAKSAIQDELLKEAYKAKANSNQTAYNIAFKDYLSEPTIALLDDTNYAGNANDKFLLLVKDTLKVTEIKFEILDQDDTIIEAGFAKPTDSSNAQWEYIATEDNPDYKNSNYRVTMTDTPRKKTVVIKNYGDDQA